MIAIVATHLFVPESPVQVAGEDRLGRRRAALGRPQRAADRRQRGRRLGLGRRPAPSGCSRPRRAHAAGLDRLRAPHARAARRHADDGASAAVLTTNLTALLGRLRDVRLVHPHPPASSRCPTVDSGFGFGATVTEAGLFLLPSALVMLFAGPISGWLGTRFGSRLPLLARHRRLARVSFTLPRRSPTRSAGEIYLGTHPDGGRHRARVRRDGEPDRRGGRSDQDRGGHRR